MAQYYEWSEDGMEKVGGVWGTYVHSDDYEELQRDMNELQKKYDALVNKISEAYWAA